MPTLLVTSDPQGILTTCGPHCYNAVFNECHCICGGSNHSQGYDRALHNSLTLISRFKKDNPDISLSLHSKRQKAKLEQTKIKFWNDQSKTYKSFR